MREYINMHSCVEECQEWEENLVVTAGKGRTRLGHGCTARSRLTNCMLQPDRRAASATVAEHGEEWVIENYF